ncbi:MAG: Gfo/Idh/MocA family oxidoreductase [Lachnospiraceae bacterium]|nr:Gfo/Idh/MocA family oxidoreductase [Lachnospiraceae bacterium]
MEHSPMRTGVIGCGAISDIYLKNMTERFDNLEVTACAAGHLENAVKKAREYGLKACTVEELLADQSIELAVILTPAPTHYELIKRALNAGKHVYTEKTITVSTKTARELLDLADEKGLYLGAAPDTFLGASWQTARQMIDEGRIGEITSFQISANRDLDVLTSMFGFLRMPGGGICYDYGVYYLTALVSLLGPAKRVCAVVKNRKPLRVNVLPQSPEYGQEFAYPNESQVTAVVELENAVTGNFALNGDNILPDQSLFMIYGTKGILKLTDPNQFGGKNALIEYNGGDACPAEWREVENAFAYGENSRGLGPSEMARAIREGRPCRACKEMAYHVLDIIDQMMKSSESGRFEAVPSTCGKPEPLGVFHTP